ncbi:hypothetical protein FBBNIHIM_10070 [Pseudocitrobacter vendiensis]|uniref:Uncharacterized protein n=1 Tax=Pseudocitrobacter vendiensis TaxID=2488306 RepID=A0ABN8TDC9_9ENTR|nr:hypothetical protein FBBNIHIM_10070 [Pseudocitrobacter vendiensis]
MPQKIKNKIKDIFFIFRGKIKTPFSGVFVIAFSIWFIKSTIEDMAMYQFTSLFHYGEIIYFNGYQIVLPLGIPIFFFAMATIVFSFFRKGTKKNRLHHEPHYVNLNHANLSYSTPLSARHHMAGCILPLQGMRNRSSEVFLCSRSRRLSTPDVGRYTHRVRR